MKIEWCNKYKKECIKLACKDFQGFRNFNVCEWYEEIEGKNTKINIFESYNNKW